MGDLVCRKRKATWIERQAAALAKQPTRIWLISAPTDWFRMVRATAGDWRRRFYSRREITKLSNRELSDIGLTRDAAEIGARKPFWQE